MGILPDLNDTADPDQAEIPAGRLARHRMAIFGGIGAFVALGVFWALVFSGTLTPHNPDRLADRAWTTQAEASCLVVENQIAKLPNAGSAKDPDERAVALDEGSRLLRGMVAKLHATLPSDVDGQRTVKAWLDDWQVYLEDRQTYSDNLRTEGGKAKPLFRALHGSTAKQTISDFADANSMSSCGAPLDL